MSRLTWLVVKGIGGGGIDIRGCVMRAKPSIGEGENMKHFLDMTKSAILADLLWMDLTYMEQ